MAHIPDIEQKTYEGHFLDQVTAVRRLCHKAGLGRLPPFSADQRWFMASEDPVIKAENFIVHRVCPTL